MDEIDEEFRAAMSDVAPLDDSKKQKALRREMPKAVTLAQLERRYAALGLTQTPAVDPNELTLGDVPQVEPRDVLAWKKDGVQHEVFSRLKAGRYPLEGSLDLHRLTVREARDAVYKFFRLADAKGWRTVLIAHGRGEQSATPARIKSYVAHWLGQLPQIIAYVALGVFADAD